MYTTEYKVVYKISNSYIWLQSKPHGVLLQCIRYDDKPLSLNIVTAMINHEVLVFSVFLVAVFHYTCVVVVFMGAPPEEGLGSLMLYCLLA